MDMYDGGAINIAHPSYIPVVKQLPASEKPAA
jgi:hypothetical protein